MSKLFKFFAVHPNLSRLLLVFSPFVIVCAFVALFYNTAFAENMLYSAGNIFGTETTWLVLLVICLIYIAVTLIRKVLRAMERKKLETLLQSAWRTGKVVHKGKVYLVEEFSDLQENRRDRKKRCLIVRSEDGDSMIYRLPVEKADAYTKEENP